MSCGYGASRRSKSSAWRCLSSSGRTTSSGCWRSTTTEARPRCDATSSGWTRRRRSEYRQTTVQEPWGGTRSLRTCRRLQKSERLSSESRSSHSASRSGVAGSLTARLARSAISTSRTALLAELYWRAACTTRTRLTSFYWFKCSEYVRSKSVKVLLSQASSAAKALSILST